MNTTVPRLKSARYIAGYRFELTFEDGRVGELDLKDELWGDVFEPLRDLDKFKNFRVDKELHTIVWPAGADLAPEYLYEAFA